MPRPLVRFAAVFTATVTLALFASTRARAEESSPPPVSPWAYSVALEADALAYPLAGYSAAIRVSHENGLSYALGTGRYTLPTFLVKSQATFEEARWTATSESIQVLRAGYRFFGPRKSGPALDAILMNQLWHVEATRLGGDTRFKTIEAGVSAGYYVHLGPHFYLFPIASAVYRAVYSGATSVQSRTYDYSPIGVTGSVHLGWEL